MLKTRLPLRPVSGAGTGTGQPGVSRGSLQLEGYVRPPQHQQLGRSETEAAMGGGGTWGSRRLVPTVRQQVCRGPWGPVASWGDTEAGWGPTKRVDPELCLFKNAFLL